MKRLISIIFALLPGINAFAMDSPMADVGQKRTRPAYELESEPEAMPTKVERKEYNETLKERNQRIELILKEASSKSAQAVEKEKKALFQEYPEEIQARVRGFLNTAPGFGIEKFYNIAKNIRAQRLVSKEERDRLDDPQFIDALIIDLALRYARGDIIKVVLALHTKSAADWLNKKLLKVANNNLDTDKLLLSKMSEEIIEQLNQGHIDVALFLINSAKFPGKDIYLLKFSYTNKDEDNLLIAAARAGNLQIFNKILKQSLEYINFVNTKTGNTALFEAIPRRHTQIALSLLHAGAHPFLWATPDMLLDAALLYASSNNDTEVVKELLKNPSVIDRVDFDNDFHLFTPLYNAIEHNNYPMFRLLVDIPGIKFNGDILYKALERNTQIVKDIILRNPNVNLTASLEREPTHAAFGVFEVSNTGTPAVNDSDTRERLQLILPGISVDQRDYSGVTLLMHAVKQAKAKTVEALLAANANVAGVDGEGHNALWYAQQLKTHNKDYIIKMLQDAAVRQNQARKNIQEKAEAKKEDEELFSVLNLEGLG
ncbi:hypothetical protein BH09DEP1_BH09DEP1_2460 [soil metagenome]